jgi:Phage gp6-like head-tail connector protein
MPFDVGDSVPIAVDVKDAAGAPTNASTVALTITLPDGTTVTPSVTNPPSVTGQYRVTYVPTVEGRFAWRFVTTTPSTAYQDVFEVRSTVSPALLSLADAKAHLNITSTSSDDELREFLEAATAAIEEKVGPIVRRTHTEQFTGGGCRIYLHNTEVLAVTALTLISDGSTPVSLSELNINGSRGVITRKNGSAFPTGQMSITYTVGRSYVDPNWTLAAKIIVEHNWETQLGNLPSIQGDDTAFAPAFGGPLIPPRAMALLRPDAVTFGFA